MKSNPINRREFLRTAAAGATNLASRSEHASAIAELKRLVKGNWPRRITGGREPGPNRDHPSGLPAVR